MYWPSSLVCGSVPLSASSIVPGSLWGLSLQRHSWRDHKQELTEVTIKEPCSTRGSHSPVLLPSSHALLIHRAIELTVSGKDDFIVNDDGLYDFVNVCLACYRILAIRDGHQGWAEADGQIVWIHHVLITVLGQAEGKNTCMFVKHIQATVQHTLQLEYTILKGRKLWVYSKIKLFVLQGNPINRWLIKSIMSRQVKRNTTVHVAVKTVISVCVLLADCSGSLFVCYEIYPVC